MVFLRARARNALALRLAGLDPDTQPIEIVGLRPGEKLHEELFYDAETVERTESEKVLRATAEPPPPGMRDAVRRILTLANGEDEDRLAELLKACANDPATFAATADRRDIGQAVGPGRATPGGRTTPAVPTTAVCSPGLTRHSPAGVDARRLGRQRDQLNERTLPGRRPCA